jgi:hypothetical protein
LCGRQFEFEIFNLMSMVKKNRKPDLGQKKKIELKNTEPEAHG